ncbi:MAG: long-chain fatty acid--CoA ligase [Betaproteobacteria bacterium SG8_39]|nr:MAG: long-chain fatty acid--CoA ligase [Betaproteobacteria bacterium SG8_39]
MQPRHFRFWPKDLPRHLLPTVATLHARLADAAHRSPDKPLTVFFGGVLRYGEAWQAVERLAGFLQHDCGLEPGERVLIDLQSSPQFLIALYAALRADLLAVPVSPMCVARELAETIEDCGARAAIVGQENWPQLEGLVGRTPLARVIVTAYHDAISLDNDLPLPDAVATPRVALDTPGVTLWHAALAAARAPRPSRATADTLCLLPYTSGSTGRPKGCMHTHATVMHNVVGAVLWEAMHDKVVALATAPMFHVTGLIHSLLATVEAGGTLVIQPRWDPQVAARLIERHGCTHWANVPTMVVDLLSHPLALAHDVSSLECVFGGGASMPEAIAQKLLDRCGIAYMEGYGMTETISQTHSNPANHLKKQCLGIPVFDTESRVVDPETLRVLEPDEAGEIVVRGPQLLKGYWGNEKASRDSWVKIGGRPFFRTGDLGRMDAEGYFFIADRLKRMINAAGYKVWPAEVESAMYRHPAIQECCVIAAPDARRGETVKAVIALKPEHRATTKAEDILAWAHGEMAAYKAPRRIEFVDALPRSGSGKIQWRALQEKEFA